MKFIKSFLSFFGTITTAIVFVVNLNYLSVEEHSPNRYIMLQILLAGFATALVTAAFFALMEKLGRHFIIGTIIHFIIMCVIMVWLSVMFEWYSFGLEGIIDMVVSVAIVYVLVFAISYIIMKKEADEINRALKERNKDSE